MFRFFNFRRPRLKFKGRDEIVYFGEKEYATIRYEATVDMVYIYLGDVSLWNSGERISDEEKVVIKKDIEILAPGHWNVAWASSPASGWGQ